MATIHRQPNQQPADVLVVFGISGDLAKVMTFRSLYRLERRGLLNCPVVGVAVDDWTTDDLRQHARKAIEATGEPVDERVFDRFAGRLSYLSGDFGDPATFQRVARRHRRRPGPGVLPGDPAVPVRRRGRGLADAGLTASARVVVEKPFGHDQASAHALNERGPRPHRRVAALPDRPFPGQDGPGRDPLPPLLQRHAGAGLEPPARRQSWRSPWPRASGWRTAATSTTRSGALRDVVVNHLMQVVAAAAMEPPPGGDTRGLQGRHGRPSSGPWPDADPGHYVRGQYDGYRDIEGVADDSSTETYAALRLEIENWRWSGVPFFIRTGKCLPVDPDRAAGGLQAPAAAGLLVGRETGGPSPSQIVIKLDPSTGIRLRGRRPARRQHRAGADPARHGVRRGGR